MEEKTLEQRITALETELAAAKAEAKADAENAKAPEAFKLREPWTRYDPTAAMRMPASAVKAMTDVVPDMRGIAMEQRSMKGPGIFSAEGKAVERGSGWVEPRGLEPPPGLKWVDQQIDVADTLDRQELKRRLGGG